MTSNPNHPLNCILREARYDCSVLERRSCVGAGASAAGFPSLLFPSLISIHCRPLNYTCQEVLCRLYVELRSETWSNFVLMMV